MKEIIIEILYDQIEAYGHGDGHHVGITEKSVQHTANMIMQLMCDAAVRQMWYFGGWPEGFVLITELQHAYLIKHGFTELQINKSLANVDNLKWPI